MVNSDATASVIAEVRALRAELADVRDELQHAVRRMLATQDRADLAAFLPAAQAVVGGRTWAAGECVEAAMSSTEPAARDVLRIVATYSTERSGMRSFGRFLTRCDGVVCGGLRLVRVGGDESGGLYAIRVSGRSKPSAEMAPACDVADDESID